MGIQASLLEDPTPLVLVGILVVAVLAVALLRTGRGALLVAIGVVLALMLAGVGLEYLVVTEREQVEATVEQLAAALEANRRDRVEAAIDPAAAETLHLVRWAMKLVEFTEVKITQLEIDVNELTSPRTAKARLSGIVRFRGRSGKIPYESYVVDEFTAALRRTPDGWIITGYQWENDPR